MDVRCQACSSEYELDEASIGPDGTLVKCSACGHEFLATRPVPGVPPPRAAEHWQLRQPSGNTFRFRELTTLQRWIVERKVSRDDEISRTGKKWERLGNIPELATFFQVVEERVSAPAEPRALEPVSLSSPASPRRPAPGERAEGVDTARYSFGDERPLERRGAHLDETDKELHAAITGPRRRRAVLTGVMALLAVGAALHLAQPTLFAGVVAELVRRMSPAVPEDALRELEQAQARLRTDDTASLAQALQGFERALALAPDYDAAKAGLAEVLCAQAEDALAGQPGDAKGLLARAQQLVTELERASPNLLGTRRAAAECHRVAGDRAAAVAAAERARQLAADDSRLNYVLGAIAAQDAAAIERAIRHLDISLEGEPQQSRARFVLAQVYARSGQKDKALDHARRVLAHSPNHERARALVASFEEPPPPPTPPPVVEATPVPEEPPVEAAKVPDAKAPKVLTYEQLLAQADRQRQADRPGVALRLYERAVEQNAEDPDGFTGIGWCYVDLENANAAIASFRRALELAPRFSDAHFGLAEAYRMKGMKRDAIKHYRAYLDILPDGSEAEVARRMLQELATP